MKDSQNQYSLLLQSELNGLQQAILPSNPADKLIKADLHVHDMESRVPDEALGRLLGISETWVTTDQVRDTQRNNGVELLTITNHNNARACWKMLDEGYDILPAAEFTCSLDKPYTLQIHVLAYGFSPSQEDKLNSLRSNLYNFLHYCMKHNIPTVLSHPTKFYAKNLSVVQFDLLYLLFDRFEALNGRQSIFNNLLTLKWIQSFTEEKISATEKRFGISTSDFTQLPQKALTGGSDDHFALYTGITGTLIDISPYDDNASYSSKALMAIREGRVAPFGDSAKVERLTMTSLVFFFQIINNIKVPKFQDVMFAPCSSQDKIAAIATSNIIRESRENPQIKSYAEIFENTLRGNKVNRHNYLLSSGNFGFVVDHLNYLAEAFPLPTHQKDEVHRKFIENIYTGFFQSLYDKAQKMNFLGISNKERLKEKLFELELSLDFRDWQSLFAQENSPLKPYVELLNPLFHVLLLNFAFYRTQKTNSKKRKFRTTLASQVMRSTSVHDNTLFLSTSISQDKPLIMSLWDNSGYADVLLITKDNDTNDSSGFTKQTIKLLVEMEIILSKNPYVKLDLFSLSRLYEIFNAGNYKNIICSANPTVAIATYLLMKTFEVPASIYISKDWLKLSIILCQSNSKTFSQTQEYFTCFYRSFDKLLFDSQEDRNQFLSLYAVEESKMDFLKSIRAS